MIQDIFKTNKMLTVYYLYYTLVR